MITPSGKVATIIDTYPEVGEALVRWDNCTFARFKFRWLAPTKP